MEKRRSLAIFAKEPVPGRVKTRLASVISPAAAAEIARAFLLDGLDRFEQLPVRRVVVFDPPEAVAYFQSLAAGRYELQPQSSGDLGARLQNLFEQEFAGGAVAIVAIGIDSPTLPTSLVMQAFEELTRADVVLGPATDGGYYLLGCSRWLPEIFAEISWSTADVFRQTVDRVQAGHARLALLPPWYDVDTVDDWRFLQAHITAMRLAGIDPQLPRTEALLGRLD